MKKIFPVLAVVLLVVGCAKRESIYKENLEGRWIVYKYLLYNVDKTSLFGNRNPEYAITFTSNSFAEVTKPFPPDSVILNGTYSFADNDQKIVLEHTELTTTYIYDSSNTNIIDSTVVTKTHKREFTIFNLTKDHVQLRTDSSQLYMRKPPVE